MHKDILILFQYKILCYYDGMVWYGMVWYGKTLFNDAGPDSN